MRFNKSTFKNDFLASIIVFLVALPLCMGIALASGVPPILGLITGVIGGLIVGPIAGVPLQVSGPAAGLAIMVFQYVDQFGLSSLVVLGGVTAIFQISIGVFKLGTYFRAVSPALVKGLLAGIGATILISQIHVGLESDPTSNGVKNILMLPEVFMNAMNRLDSVFVLVLSVAMMLAWPKIAKGKMSLIPAPLVGVVFGAVLANFWLASTPFVSLPDNILEGLSFFPMDDFQGVTFPMIATGVGIAFIASVETLLSASAVDRLSNSTDSNYNKEMIAQGIGNGVAGMFGALPMTGVIVRSSANVNSGGKTWQSAFLHGVWLVLFVFMLPQVLQLIPVASLAAILVITGIKLLDLGSWATQWRQNKGEFATFAVTLCTIVAYDLLTGVVAGFVTSLVVMFWHTLEFSISVDKNSSEMHVNIQGKASFLHLPKIVDLLPRQVGELKKITVDLSDATYVDQAFKDQLAYWKDSTDELKECAVIVLPKMRSNGRVEAPIRSASNH